LTGGKGRIDVDELDLAAGAVAVRSLLVGEEFAERQEIVTPDQQIAPAVAMGPLLGKPAHQLPRRRRRLGQNLLPLHLPGILQPVLLPDLHTLQPARKQLSAPVRRYLLAGLQEADEFKSVLVG
jgi:hypothetical protein